MAASIDGIKNISGRDLVVPGLGGRIVFAGQVVPCPVEQVTGYTQQEGTWVPVGKKAEAVHAEMLAGIAELLGTTSSTTPAAAEPVATPEEN